MSDIPPVGTPLGVLSTREILIEYDGPKLFTCVNELGQQYLAIFVDEDDASQRYILPPHSNGRMRDPRDERSGWLLDRRESPPFLSRSWADLSWEDGLPLGLSFASLRDVRGELDQKRSRAPHTLRREFELTFEDFMFGHDLAQMSLAVAL